MPNGTFMEVYMTKQHYGLQAHSIGARYPYHPVLRGDTWYVVNLETGLYAGSAGARDGNRKWSSCAGATAFIDEVVLGTRLPMFPLTWAPHPKDVRKPAVQAAPIHSKFVHSDPLSLQHGTHTGRLSASAPEYQDIPRDGSFWTKELLAALPKGCAIQATQDVTRSRSAEVFTTRMADAVQATWNHQKRAALAQVYPGRYDDWKDVSVGPDAIRELVVEHIERGDEQTNDFAGFPYA